jgi:tetratricopeptide (TPR) repeat protein
MSAGALLGAAQRALGGARGGVLLVALVAAVYIPSLRLGFAYDDDMLIVERPPPSAFSDLAESFTRPHWPEGALPYYRPLPALLISLQRYAHGDAPFHFHALNVALICAAALAARAFLRGPAVSASAGSAWLLAALFALHPISASVVHPISGREALFAGLLAIAAIDLQLRARSAAARLLAATCATAALFAREQAIAIPILFAIADWLGISRNPARSAAQWLRRQLPLAVGVGLYFALRAHAFGDGSESIWKPPRYAWLPLATPLFALRAIFAPSFELAYEPRPELWLGTARTWISSVLGIAIAGIAIAVARRDARLHSRLVFLSVLVAATLLPSANLVHQETEFAERFVFLPWAGFVGALGVVGEGLRAGAGFVRARASLAFALIAACAACAAISVRHAELFRDHESFFAGWIASDPGYAKAHFSFGQHRMKQGRADEARASFERALSLDPNYPAAHNNLGALAYQRGDRAAAREHWEAALRWDPAFAFALNNLAALRAEAGDLDGAAELYRRSLAIRGSDARVLRLLGSVELARGRADAAVPLLERALAEDPEVELGTPELARARRAIERGKTTRNDSPSEAVAPE